MPEIPYGFCHCGCGQKTALARVTKTAKGHVRGEPLRYLPHHRRRWRSEDNYVVELATGCWLWQGATDSRGYGKFNVRGRSHKAHKDFYERLIGPVPSGCELHHTCTSTLCVNPDHLEPITHAEHMRRHFLGVPNEERQASTSRRRRG